LRSRAQLEGERKHVTILFADIKRSMELASQVDAEDWHDILDRFFRICCESVHRFEGTINQYTGDGIMALFGAPLAIEEHARRACYSALYLREKLHDYSQELRRERGLDLSVRMGLDSGEVVVGKIGDDLRMDYTAQGPNVGLAARMQQLAEGGKIYLTDGMASRIQGYFQLEDLGDFKVKGMAEPVRVHALEGPGLLRTRLGLSQSRGLTRFVGRSAELRLLENAFQDVSEGCLRAFGVVGEPGIGKSRLCMELAGRCRLLGAPVFEAHCSPFGSTVPFSAALDLLRSAFRITDQDKDQEARDKIAGRSLLLDESLKEFLPTVFAFMAVPDPKWPASATSPETRQTQLFEFIGRLVRARSAREPAVVLVDDLQWADSGSQLFLDHLFEAIEDTRTLVLLNFRPGYEATWMRKAWYQQVPLGPLDSGAMCELIRDLLGDDESLGDLPEIVQERSWGNPFFAEEIVKCLVDMGHVEGRRGAFRLANPLSHGSCCLEIPDSIETLLASSLDRLPAREKRVLQEACVIGKCFSRPVLELVSRCSPAELEESLHRLCHMGFIREESLYPIAEFSFHHPLLQEVAYATLLKANRARCHAAVARAIEAESHTKLDQNAALLAYHCEQAEEIGAATGWHARAARWAGLTHVGEGLHHWRRVRELVRRLPGSPEVRADWMTACHQILNLGWRTGLPREEAAQLFAEGSALAGSSGDVRGLALLKGAYGTIRGLSGDTGQALAYCRDAARLADGIGDADVRVAIAWRLAYPLLLGGELQEALAVTEQAADDAGRQPDIGASLVLTSPLVGLALLRVMVLCAPGHVREAVEHKEELLRLAREVNHHEALCLALSVMPYLAWARGDEGPDLEAAGQAVALGRKLGSPFFQLVSLTALGLASLRRGQCAEALAALEHARSIATASGTGEELQALLLAGLAEGQFGVGKPRQAVKTAQSAVAHAQASGTRLYEIHAQLALARLRRRAGGRIADTATADALGRALDLSKETGALLYQPFLCVERAELARTMGDDAAWRGELREARRLFVDVGAPARAARAAEELKASEVGGQLG
jgi:class 3 adenylate cyclase/tetratricopeptide (TPR) repeat protein